MLSCTEESVSDLSVLNWEGIVHYTDSALVFNRETNEDGNCRQVALHEVRSSIKWVDPNTGVLRVESLKRVNRDLIFSVILAEGRSNPLTTLGVLSVQEGSLDVILNLCSNRSGINGRLHLWNAFFRLFSFDSKGWIQGVQADLEGLLDTEVGDCDWIINTFLLGLMLAWLFHLSNNLATLFWKVDADGEELCDIDVCMLFLADWLNSISTRSSRSYRTIILGCFGSWLFVSHIGNESESSKASSHTGIQFLIRVHLDYFLF